MRAIVLAVLACCFFSSVALAAEKNPNQVLMLGDVNQPNEEALNRFAERLRSVAEHNAQLSAPTASTSFRRVLQDEDPLVFILWIGKDRHAAALYKVLESVLQSDLVEPGHEDLTSVVIKSSSPLFSLAQQAFSEVATSSVETLEMPQTAAVKQLLEMASSRLATK